MVGTVLAVSIAVRCRANRVGTVSMNLFAVT